MNTCFFTGPFSVALLVRNWTALPQISKDLETTLSLVSDMLNSTCDQLEFNDRDILLRGQLNGNYCSLKVMMTMTNYVAFGPELSITTCHRDPPPCWPIWDLAVTKPSVLFQLLVPTSAKNLSRHTPFSGSMISIASVLSQRAWSYCYGSV